MSEELKNAFISMENGELIECIDYLKEIKEDKIENSLEGDKVENNPFFMLGGPKYTPPPVILYKHNATNSNFCKVEYNDTNTLLRYFEENSKVDNTFKFEIKHPYGFDYEGYCDLYFVGEEMYKFTDFIKYLSSDLGIKTICVLNTPVTGELAYTAFVADEIELGNMGFLAFGYYRVEMKDSKWIFHKLYVKSLLETGIRKKFISEIDMDNILSKKSNVVLTNTKLKMILNNNTTVDDNIPPQISESLNEDK